MKSYGVHGTAASVAGIFYKDEYCALSSFMGSDNGA